MWRPKLQKAAESLDQNAVNAVSRYQFIPAEYQGMPVPVRVNVEVDFKFFNGPTVGRADFGQKLPNASIGLVLPNEGHVVDLKIPRQQEHQHDSPNDQKKSCTGKVRVTGGASLPLTDCVVSRNNIPLAKQTQPVIARVSIEVSKRCCHGLPGTKKTLTSSA